MTELAFTKNVSEWETEEIWVDADFIINLTFDDTERKDNEIAIWRSLTGQDWALAWRKDTNDSVFEKTFTGVGSGTYVKIATRNQPKSGYYA